jgi:uncharacterized protein (DUF169 family)
MIYSEIEKRLTESLSLRRRPVAVTYHDREPEGLPKFAGTVPSGCSFWRLAASGSPFYTVPGDHYNCPVGSYTHGIPLPEERAPELNQTLGLMVQIGYLKMEEVPGVFRLPRPPAAISYSPLGDTAAEPAAVIITGTPSQVTLLIEACIRAGVYSPLPMLHRPTCMALPAALADGAVASGACIGNRVYTDLPDGEMYLVTRGGDIAKAVSELATVIAANRTLEGYHQERRRQLATA